MFHRKKIIIVMCLFAMIAMSIGCEPLRKKFVRKKKEEKESGILPVLEPLDYPAKKNYSPLEQYQRHYALWRVWDQELQRSVRENSNVKAQKYNVVQLIEQIEEMQKWVVEEKQKQLASLIRELRGIQESFHQPSVTNSTFRTLRILERSSKTIRHDFSPKQMAGFVIPSNKDDLVH